MAAQVRDVTLPGGMKDLMNRVAEAKKAAEANLIARREETAAMRNQAGTATRGQGRSFGIGDPPRSRSCCCGRHRRDGDGPGTVVTGKIEQGIVRTGGAMEIVGLAVQPRPDVVTQVETFSDVLDVGRAGRPPTPFFKGVICSTQRS